MSTLIISVPGQPDRELKLGKEPQRLGRDSDNDILIESPIVSRKHGLLELRSQDWVYTDLESRNGSLVYVETPLEFELNYERTASHLLFDWLMLVGLSLLLSACTIFILKRQDVVA